MDAQNPYNPPQEPNPFLEEIHDPVDQARIEEAAKRLVKEKQDKSTALQLFLTGLIGCFAPILAIYGLVFLLRRPHPFPRKGLAIAGTVLHFIWSGLLVLSILMSAAAG
ncbi:MAG: hypothetical protein CMJ64_26955 [Planctomycetaceae bacterium]|nr:hypothetical protein [Planctomycetaceae bacterium]